MNALIATVSLQKKMTAVIQLASTNGCRATAIIISGVYSTQLQ